MRKDDKNMQEVINNSFHILHSDAAGICLICKRKYTLLKFHITLAELEKQQLFRERNI